VYRSFGGRLLRSEVSPRKQIHRRCGNGSDKKNDHQRIKNPNQGEILSLDFLLHFFIKEKVEE
jgi:hypothetical protein